MIDELARSTHSFAGRECGWTSTSWDAASPSKAIAELQREHRRLVVAVQLPETLKPPAGFKRWYVVHPSPEGEGD